MRVVRPVVVLSAVALCLLSGPPAASAAAPGNAPAVTRGSDPNTETGLDAGNAVQAGQNIGNIVKAWGAALLLGMAGLMGLAALAKRNVAEGLTLLGIVLLVGGFIFADGAVKTFVQSIWGAFTGGA
jgi:hypothetical protein